MVWTCKKKMVNKTTSFFKFLKQRENRLFHGFFNFWHKDQSRKLVDTTGKSALKLLTLQVIRFIRAKIRYIFAKLRKIYRRLYRLSPPPPQQPPPPPPPPYNCVLYVAALRSYIFVTFRPIVCKLDNRTNLKALFQRNWEIFPNLPMSKVEKTLEGLM